MPEVLIPTTLRKLTGDRSAVRVDGATIAEILINLDARFPGIGERVLQDGPHVRRFVNIYVAEDDIRFLNGLDTAVEADSRVSIIPAVAGGAISAGGTTHATFRAARPLRIGLLGCGTVGAPVAQALLEDGDGLERAAGTRLELARVAVRHPHKKRSVELPRGIVTNDALAVAIDPAIDIVIEVIGGIDPALGCILGALADNKAVVTANKELLAGPGADLLDDSTADLHFEASVCGAIPIVRTLKEYCAGDRIESFTGILSGTCNFVLSEMTRTGCSFDEAVELAQDLGYAEADPTADVEALDSAAKLVVLARVAFGVSLRTEDIDRKGIVGIDQGRIAEAASEGYVFKLVAGARRVGDDVHAWVRPVLVRGGAPLADVNGAENALSIETVRAGRLRFHGQGAGGAPTAAAVLADLVAVAHRQVRLPTNTRVA